MSFRIGLLSDTHGLMRPEALQALQGCAQIIHGGDIGSAAILEALSVVAPVIAVRGNNDKGGWADPLPESLSVEMAGASVHVLHDLGQLEVDPVAARVNVVVSGHSHQPSIQRRAGVWYVNPGSAGPRRFKLPVTVAEILIEGATMTARIIDLKLAAARRR